MLSLTKSSDDTALSSSTTITANTSSNCSYFPAHKDSPIFSPEIASKLVGYGCRRVKRSGIGNFEPSLPQHEALVTHSEFELGDRLGKGSFSSVFSVVSMKNNDDSKNNHQLTAETIVIKVLRRKMMANPRMFAACAGDIFKEGLILSKLNHKNVIAARGFAEGGILAYKNGRHDAFFIVLDKLEYILSDQIRKWSSPKKKLQQLLPTASKKKTKSLQVKTNILLQLADAIGYIHSQGMIHRDIKPDNIGFDAEGTLKVFDFDVARFLPNISNSTVEGSEDVTFKLTKKVGSPRYMSPECGLGEPYNAKTDVYAFGLLCHEILTLKKPFCDLPSECHDKAVFVGNERPTIPSSWTIGLRAIVERCWSPQITARPTMKEARELLDSELADYMSQKTNNKSWSLLRSSKTLLPAQ